LLTWEETKKAFINFVLISVWRWSFEKLRRIWKITLKCILKKWSVMMWTGMNGAFATLQSSPCCVAVCIMMMER
jgi:hypothetical protein